MRALKPAQLRLLVEIHAQGQVQLAAAALSMTQPAASRMLAEAEREVGVPIFERLPKGMVPTEAGHLVLRHARAILRESQNMASELAALKGGYGGSVRVGSVTGPALGYLVPAIRAIKDEGEAVEIAVDVSPSRDLLRLLAAGEMDFAIGRMLPEYDSRLFEILPMRDEKLALLVRAGHPLARSPAVTFTELIDYEWIMQERGAPIREATARAFATMGLAEPKNMVVSASLLLTISYLSRSNAVAAVSDEVAHLLIDEPVGGGFVMLRQPRETRVSPCYMLTLRSRPLSPLARRLRELVLNQARAMPQLSMGE